MPASTQIVARRLELFSPSLAIEWRRSIFVCSCSNVRMASSRATLQTERERVCVERDTDSLYSHSSLLQSPRFDRIISENLAGNMHPAMWPRISFAGRAQCTICRISVHQNGADSERSLVHNACVGFHWLLPYFRVIVCVSSDGAVFFFFFSRCSWNFGVESIKRESVCVCL